MDAVDGERAFARVPEAEDHRQREHEERGRDRVGHAEADVQDVRGHRAEHADHDDRRPVDPGDVAAGGELEGQRGRQGHAAEADRGDGAELLREEVRGGLTHTGGQHLDHPEVDGDFRNLARHVGGEGGATTAGEVLCAHARTMTWRSDLATGVFARALGLLVQVLPGAVTSLNTT